MDSVTTIEPRFGWRSINWRELWQYRDLLYFLVWRDIKGRYAQSVLGVGWAVIQPVFNMIVFSVVFGRLANVDSDGVPYAIFSYAALVPWTYFSNALTTSSTSLVTNNSLLNKVYFPRLLIPIAPSIGKLVDFSIAFVIMFFLMIYYRVTPNINALAIPLLVVIMVLTATGAGMWLTALAIRYRDVKHAMGFSVQLLMYLSPVVYPTTSVSSAFRNIYAINPMVGVIEGFRASLLGTIDMPWTWIGIGFCTSCLLAISGAFYFRRMERTFADIA